MLISMASDARQFLVSASTHPTVLKVDSEVTVEAGGVSKLHAIMESTGYINSCDFYHAKISKFSNPEFASISGAIARVE